MLSCGCRRGQNSECEDEQNGKIRKKKSNRGLLRTALTLVTRCRRTGPHHTMPAAERAMKAAILIQAWYRRYLARMEIRRRYTWNIFQSIEYVGEQDQVKLYCFFNALLAHMPAAKSISWSNDKTGSSDSLSEIESSYKGIHIGNPLTRSDLDNLIENFRHSKQARLHEKYVASILWQATNVLKQLPNLNPASVTISKQITIVGDLHGKLDDLIVIFHKNGLPSPGNPYIFNGDFVDRGKKGLEVLLVLLSCLLVFPGGVFLNRGNHEDHVMNTRYGFIREVRAKYKAHADKLLSLIEEVYRWLPLGSLVNNKVLVVHGGISDLTDLHWIKKLERQKYVSLLRPPLATDSNSSGQSVDKLEWKQVFDILWSDPQINDGCIPNALRGAGTYFGPDVTQKFLSKFGLSLLVRSHECKTLGYEVMHSNKVITIFSASNYYEEGSNKGAYLKLMGPDLTQHFVQFKATKTRAKRLTIRQRVGLVETSAFKELNYQINMRKDLLTNAFKSADQSNKGLISTNEWCSAMESGTGLKLPWRMLRSQLVALDSATNCVEYMTTFQMRPTKKNSSLTVVDTLYRNKTSLEAIFRIIDKDNSGFISREEFADACALLSEHLSEPISVENFSHLCQSIDRDHDGQIDLNEFLETFRLVDQGRSEMDENSGSEEDD